MALQGSPKDELELNMVFFDLTDMNPTVLQNFK